MFIELKQVDSVPETEFSREFAQGMVDRMGMSYAKYGAVAEGYPHRVDAIESLKKRLDKYAESGNTEWLMDVANFAMIEFMRPRHPDAHYKPTDSKDSPGRKWHGEVDSNKRANDPRKWVK